MSLTPLRPGCGAHTPPHSAPLDRKLLEGRTKENHSSLRSSSLSLSSFGAGAEGAVICPPGVADGCLA